MFQLREKRLPSLNFIHLSLQLFPVIFHFNISLPPVFPGSYLLTCVFHVPNCSSLFNSVESALVCSSCSKPISSVPFSPTCTNLFQLLLASLSCSVHSCQRTSVPAVPTCSFLFHLVLPTRVCCSSS